MQDGMSNLENIAPLLTHRVVLWSPQYTNRFVVGGANEIRTYEWDSKVCILLEACP